MTVQMPISARAFVLVLAAFCLAQIASAQTRSSAANTRGAASAQAAGEPPGMSVTEWLQRMHAGARQRNYVGTFVCPRPAATCRVRASGMCATASSRSSASRR
jgi:sigma-E factor negative regulatory protein RseB